MSGKGSGARPFSVPRGQFEASHKAIFGERKRVQWVPPSQCGDCGGTRKVDGEPCKACAPADDGPEGRKDV